MPERMNYSESMNLFAGANSCCDRIRHHFGSNRKYPTSQRLNPNYKLTIVAPEDDAGIRINNGNVPR